MHRLRVTSLLNFALISIFLRLSNSVVAAATADNLAYVNKYREISAVVNAVGHIPCSVGSFHDVSMILWFKDSSGSPIYSYDARYEGEPRHLTLKNEWGLRLYFRVWPSARRSPALMIRDLRPTDEGLYRCRVDYRNSPTANSVVRLKIIEPPERLEVRETSQLRPISDQQIVSAGHHSDPSLNDITYLGPYVEGQNVTVVCTAFGGKPPPTVVWLENGNLVDFSYESSAENYVTNELTIVDLSKRHSHDLYTCQASNHNETKAISHRINIDVYLTAKHIELEIPDQMTAGVEYNLVCKTAGAYPSVRMEFWKVPKRIGSKFQTKCDADNITMHSSQFKPTPEDDESVIFCRAENPWIHGTQLEAKQKIRVIYSPVVILRFGSSKTGNFSEGESVLLECHIKSNPALKEIRWYHQDEQLTGNRSLGVVITGFTLQLTHLTHLSGGRYTCEGFNQVGKGTSNSINILINVAPRCSIHHGSREQVIPINPGEARQLKCNIVAWPPDVSFFWTFKRNGTVLPIPTKGNRFIAHHNDSQQGNATNKIETLLDGSQLKPENKTTAASKFPTLLEPEGETEVNVTSEPEESVFPNSDLPHGGEVLRVKRKSVKTYETLHHQSVLTYEILSEQDYGTVACWARNSYGEQLRPCLFFISSLEAAEANPTDMTGVALPTQSNDQGIRTAEQEKFMTKSARMKEEEEVDEKEEEEPGDPLSYKLPGTLGITIIWMGVLIFIGGLLGCSWLRWKRKAVEEGAAAAAAAQFTEPTAPFPIPSSPAFQAVAQKILPPPSPSIHNGSKISSKTATASIANLHPEHVPCPSVSSKSSGSSMETIASMPAVSLLFSHSKNTDKVVTSTAPNLGIASESDDTYKHSLVTPNLAPCSNDPVRVSIIHL